MSPSNIYEAISLMIATNSQGLSEKEVAVALWPSLSVDSAKARLSQCKSGGEQGVKKFSPGEVDYLCGLTGRPDILIGYLCAKHGFEMPARKIIMNPETELRVMRAMLRERGIDISADEVQRFAEERIISLKIEREPCWRKALRVVKRGN